MSGYTIYGVVAIVIVCAIGLYECRTRTVSVKKGLSHSARPATYRVGTLFRRWGWSVTGRWAYGQDDMTPVQGRCWTKRGAIACASKCIRSADRP